MENSFDKVSVTSAGIHFKAKHRYNPLVITRNVVITLIFAVFFVFATLNFVKESEWNVRNIFASIGASPRHSKLISTQVLIKSRSRKALCHQLRLKFLFAVCFADCGVIGCLPRADLYQNCEKIFRRISVELSNWTDEGLHEQNLRDFVRLSVHFCWINFRQFMFAGYPGEFCSWPSLHSSEFWFSSRPETTSTACGR